MSAPQPPAQIDIHRLLQPLADQKDIVLDHRSEGPCPTFCDCRLTRQALINGVSKGITRRSFKTVAELARVQTEVRTRRNSCEFRYEPGGLFEF